MFTPKRWLVALVLLATTARAADITIPTEFVGPPSGIVGFGAQMNPYLYASPNWGEKIDAAGKGGLTDENVKLLEQEVLDLKPQHVRVFFVPGWLQNLPDGVNKQGDPRMRQSLLRTLRLAQSAGASITLTTWYGEPKEPEKTARQTAEALAELLNDEHLDAIKYINMMNEPNGDWPGEEPWTLDRYNKLNRALDAELKRAHLREKLQLITGDLVEEHQSPWVANIAENLADLTDGISFHAYWDYRDTTKLIGRLDRSQRMVTTRPAIAAKPLYITEFGCQGIGCFVAGHEPGKFENGQPMAETPTQALQIGWFMMEALNRGYVATVQWDMYDCWYDRLMHYGLIADVQHGFATRPAYWVLKMFTHTARPGWRATKASATPLRQEMLMVVLRGLQGELTSYLLNRGQQPQSIRIRGFASDKQLTVITWNGDGAARLARSQERCDSDGAVNVFVPAQSIIALTTLAATP